ncbi:MAG: glutamine--fructose-6-phosphate transaminase (isomerizing), partial [Thermacetogeniaceae bacterium]
NLSGIVGYVGNRNAVSVIFEGLRTLEFHGYDSVGYALISDDSLVINKKAVKIADLEKEIDQNCHSQVGVGHIRLATHGSPVDSNAHPHCDCTGKFAVVHNGIIENFHELRSELEKKGHRFTSETDTEVIPHLIEDAYQGDLLSALRKALEQVRGSYALVVISKDQPDRLLAARKNNPIIVGLGEGENFLASGIPALLPFTRDVYFIDDGEVVEVTSDSVRVFDKEGKPVQKEAFHVDWDVSAAERGGFPHFMLKEIHEQPQVLRNMLGSLITPAGDDIVLKDLKLTPEEIQGIAKIVITACGTSFHAGLVGKQLFEKWAKIPVEVELASEFRYRDPLVGPDTLVIVISQSGETSDTLAALQEARDKGCRTLAITNVVGSTITRESDEVIYTWAGQEIAIASTKAYTAQLLVLYLLAMLFARERKTMDSEEIKGIIGALQQVPGWIEDILEQKEAIKEIAACYNTCENMFYLGRGLDWPVALEGALKLKETSYVHAEAYAAGELKHGPLALITEEVPVLALATQGDLLEKTVSNINGVKARQGAVIGVPLGQSDLVDEACDHVIRLPAAPTIVRPLLSVVALQLFAYYMSCARGCNVDQPRNLTKSVTVE